MNANAKKGKDGMGSKKTTAQLTVERQVAEATALNREVKARVAKIEELKVGIREYATGVALARPPAERNEKLEIESSEGTATISFPKEEVSLAKEADPYVLRDLKVITPEVWKTLFVEKAVLAPGFAEKLGYLSKEDQNHVRGLLEYKTATPSVNLAK